jgi:hypothetical protein
MMLYLVRREAAPALAAGEAVPAHAAAAPAQAAPGPGIAAQVRRLAWHAIGYRGGIAFPGETLFRLSMDLATGTAGVLLALAAALSPEGGGLPLQGQARRPGTGPATADDPATDTGAVTDGGAATADGHIDVPGSSGQGWVKETVITRR